jgi:hypothetical protein
MYIPQLLPNLYVLSIIFCRCRHIHILRVGLCMSIHSRTASIFLTPVARHYSVVSSHTIPSPVYLIKASISVMYLCFERSLLQ